MNDDTQLTERELAIAEKAADLAVKKMQDEFYKAVGKTLVTRIFVVLGLLAVAFATGKGWISIKG